MRDPILGELTPDERWSDSLNGVLNYQGRGVKLSVDTSGFELEQVLSWARTAVASLALLHDRARLVAASELLDNDNSNWRHYTTTDEAGNSIDVSDPELSQEEFMARLTLTSVEFSGDEYCCLGYECGTLFWGHSVLVTSFNGIAYTDSNAQLFG